MNERPAFVSRGDLLRGVLILLTLLIDQATKYLARLHYSLPNGEPDYYKVTQVLGEWLQIRLVYNYGAAFGMKPQSALPFLHPTVFYLLFSGIAILVLFLYYRKLGHHEPWPKTGVALILSGAFGNLIDRVQFHKVTDFIDVGVPGVAWRWPTFNVADSCVCVGVGLILAAPLFVRAHQGRGGTHADSPTATVPDSAAPGRSAGAEGPGAP